MSTRSWTGLVAALAVLALHASSARAQNRTWVSGTGDDLNPCSFTAPCKTYAGAFAKTAAGGEISTATSGGYGSLTISKSISIVAAGVEGSIVPLATGITIDAGASDIVHLDGLIFEGVGSGASAIRILAAGVVDIRGCLIKGFRGNPGLGIDIVSSAVTRVVISDCAITGNSAGVSVKLNGGSAQVFLNRVQIVGNTNVGVEAEGRGAVVRLNDSVITANGTGLNSASGGAILSFGNNAVDGNKIDGNPTGSLKPM